MISSMTKRRRNAARTAAFAITALVAGLPLAESASAQQAAVQRARRAAPAPVINRVAFEGYRSVERAALESVIQTRARSTYDPAIVEADAQRIRDVYSRSGRSLAQVTPRVVQLANGEVDVVYTIAEGSKTGVREIRFVGNNAISASRLRGVMTTTETNILSFLKTSDVYDPDRLAVDQELIRRYYLKNGFADFQILSTDTTFDPVNGGYIITITVNEGEQYRIGSVNVDSRIPEVDTGALRGRVSTSPGAVYNAEAVERSLQNVTTDVARRGHAFAQVRPVGTRDPATQTVALAYVIEEGPRVYIERINVRGNTRTRDYVIRREFDVGEGDAYNKVLMDRAERRLNNLGYFKKVRISNEPGSSPDRVVVNVEVEDQATGAFSISGGYSTADGIVSELSISESNFLGRGQFVRLAGSLGQRSRGVDFSFTEPYFLGYRMAAGFDVFSKYTDQTRSARYENRVVGGQLRVGLPITEEIGVTLRYSLYESQLKIPNTVKMPYNDCSFPLPGITPLNAGTGIPGTDGAPNRFFCESNGEASSAIKQSTGRTMTSLVGLTLSYNSLDSFRDPRNGFLVEVKPEVAGLGGDSKFVRTTLDGRYYRELFEDVVGIARVQAGTIAGFADNKGGAGGNLRITDHFFMG